MSGWTDDSWDAFCALVEEAWPGEFDDHAQRSWRLLIGDLEPDQAIAGLKRLLFEGHTFRPSVSEFLASIRRDASQPTFDEMFTLIFGRRGVIQTPAPSQIYPSQEALDEARRKIRAEKLAELHPLIQTFVQRQGGLARLGAIRFGEEDYGAGDKRRRDLERAWIAHTEAFDGRMVAALAAGDGPRGLARLDPLAALGMGSSEAAAVAALGAGSA